MRKKLTILKLLKNRLHLGRHKSKKHPNMDEYIFTVRNNLCVFDLEKTLAKIKIVIDVLKKLKKEQKDILVVGTKKQIKDETAQFAEGIGAHYINKRWLGGILTNFKTIKNKTRRLKELKEMEAKEELKKYTKFEQQKFKEEREKLEEDVGGIEDLQDLPAILFILDSFYEKIAMKEAKKMGITVIALMNANSDPKKAEYPVPMNTESTQALSFVLKAIQAGVAEKIIKIKKSKKAKKIKIVKTNKKD